MDYLPSGSPQDMHFVLYWKPYSKICQHGGIRVESCTRKFVSILYGSTLYGKLYPDICQFSGLCYIDFTITLAEKTTLYDTDIDDLY